MLYIVGTPIGNLDDLSYRQSKIIMESEILLTEDTSSTGHLLERIRELFDFTRNADQKVMAYHKDNEFQKLPEVMEMLQEDNEIALISQAGMPLISDPGYLLIKTVIKENIPFTVVPGPTAATTALVLSGFNPGEHMFLGFFPKKTSDVKKILEKIKAVKSIFPDMSFIFYDSPMRIQDTLEVINSSVPDISVSISREITKKFEETVRGTAKELVEHTYKGEITVVLQ